MPIDWQVWASSGHLRQAGFEFGVDADVGGAKPCNPIGGYRPVFGQAVQDARWARHDASVARGVALSLRGKGPSRYGEGTSRCADKRRNGLHLRGTVWPAGAWTTLCVLRRGIAVKNASRWMEFNYCPSHE